MNINKQNNKKENNNMGILKKFTELPGIQGLIWDLEERGVYVDDRMMVNKNAKPEGVNSLFILGCTGEQEGNKVYVNLLLGYGEQAIMMTNIQYYVDSRGNYMFVDAGKEGFGFWFTSEGWSAEDASAVRNCFIYAANAEDQDDFIEDWVASIDKTEAIYRSIPMDASHRYDPVKWITYIFNDMEYLLRRLED